jgi:hypothetical protein
VSPSTDKLAMFTSESRNAEAGYMLFEALVAVAVAGLVLTAYVRTQMLARKAALLAPDILRASAAATSIAEEINAGRKVPQQGIRDGLPYTISLRPVELNATSSESDPRPADLKPASGQESKGIPSIHQVDISLRGPHGHVLSREFVLVSAPPGE